MCGIDTILQQTDMEMSRTPRALCDWADSKASALSATREGKLYARSGAILPKKLWEEVRPLGLFALGRYGADPKVKCTPNLSNDNYDGRIDFGDRTIPPIYVEVTYAKDGYHEHLRLEVLTLEGSVNALGRVTVSGTKASGRRSIEVENEAIDHADTRGKALELLKKRMTGKSGKTYGANHVLVVVVDDYLSFRTEEDKVVLMDSAKSIASALRLDFGAVYLLGSSGNYCARVCGEL